MRMTNYRLGQVFKDLRRDVDKQTRGLGLQKKSKDYPAKHIRLLDSVRGFLNKGR